MAPVDDPADGRDLGLERFRPYLLLLARLHTGMFREALLAYV